jgi:hypothetical protein
MPHMKILLPGFAILLGMLLALFNHATDGSDAIASTVAEPLPVPRLRQVAMTMDASAANTRSPVNASPAQSILERTRYELDRLEQCSARVRYRVALFDQELIGAGTYFQSGAGQQKKLRYELRLQTDAGVMSGLQVCDGRYVWSNSENFAGPILTRIDLRRIQQRQAQLGQNGREIWAWGGLPGLLKNLEKSFQWDQALTGYLEADKTPAWSIRGLWRGAEYAKLNPQYTPQNDAAVLGGFPSQVPGSVTLYIRQQDYFPQRIEYRRPPVGVKGNVPPEEWVPCVLIEFTDIALDRPLDQGAFEFQPGKQQEIVDLTDNLLQSK